MSAKESKRTKTPKPIREHFIAWAVNAVQGTDLPGAELASTPAAQKALACYFDDLTGWEEHTKKHPGFLGDISDWIMHRFRGLLIFLVEARTTTASGVEKLFNTSWTHKQADAVKALRAAAEAIDDPFRPQERIPDAEWEALDKIFPDSPAVIRWFADHEMLPEAIRRLSDAIEQSNQWDIRPPGLRVTATSGAEIVKSVRRAGKAKNEAPATRGFLVRETKRRLPSNAPPQLISDLLALAGHSISRGTIESMGRVAKKKSLADADSGGVVLERTWRLVSRQRKGR